MKKHSKIVFLVFLELFVLINLFSVMAINTPFTETKLTASDGIEWDAFGHSVSISGDTAVVGDTWNNHGNGAAYVFMQIGTTWQEEVKLIPRDGSGHDHFGESVSISGDTIAVGAPYDSYGAVYVFVWNGITWTEEAKLRPSDNAGGDLLGWSISISGDTIVAGACYGDLKGAAYVFTRSGTTWTEEAKLTASDGVAKDYFGWSVSISGDTAVVGASEKDNRKGAAYVFTRSGTTWTEEAKLIASDGVAGDDFGFSVSTNGNTIVVGAPWKDSSIGAVYVFTDSGTSWTEESKLIAPDSTGFTLFGHSVFINDDTIVVGAPYEDTNYGAVYVYGWSGTLWILETKLVASDATGWDDVVGWSVSLSGDSIIAGNPSDDNKGSAYIFSAQPSQTIVNIDIKPGSDPNSINMAAKGVLPVAVLGGSDFDVTSIDASTIELGGVSINTRGSAKTPKLAYSFDDVNGDGITDMMTFFDIQQLVDIGMLTTTTTSLVLTGNLIDGTPIKGENSVRIVPP